MGALLIADFLPVIAIGFLLGPLVDRFSRRRLLVASDLVRVGVFAALPFAGSATVIVGLALVAGIATGFFRPAVYAGMPNLVSETDLPAANSLLQAAENVTWMIGPVIGGILVSAQGPDLAYGLNAVSFLASALLLLRIPATRLQAGTIESRGHWGDLRDGFRLVLSTRALFAVLVVWNLVVLGNAGVNVGEVVLAKESLDAGNIGFGVLVGASGLGLTVGSLAATPLLERVGVRGGYASAIGVMAIGYGVAAVAPALPLAIAGVAVGGLGNGIAVVCNALLIQQGAPDALRGRAFTVIMSSNYVLLGLAMAGSGPLVDTVGPRWVWGGAALVFALASLAALVLARGVRALEAAKLEEPIASRV